MHPKPSNKKKLIQQVVGYTGMTVAVIAIVSVIFMFILGYRFDKDNGHIEQYAFLQFNSSPSGATVSVDGIGVSAQTPTKTSVPAGSHNVVMRKPNYQDWSKSVDVKSATLIWLNYAILVPNKLNTESVAKFNTVYSSLASPKGASILVQEKADYPTFDIVDITSDSTKSTKITIPTKSYSESTTVGVVHSFNIKQWDDGGRYVLLNHTYADKNEWLVMDTQDVNLTKNITQTFNIAISDIYFSGTNGNVFYVQSSNDIRKLDLSAGTISKQLVGNVTSFNLFEANVVTYVGIGDAVKNEQVAGFYREGDENSHVLRTTTNKDTPLKIATARYFNEDYVVISEGKKVDILRGSYPTSVKDTASLKQIASFQSKLDINNLTFSPSGDYILVQSGEYFASYDLERQIFSESSINGTGTVSVLKWLDDNYLWSDRDNSLTIREYDGQNSHKINPVILGQDAVMTHNKRYIYSINKTATNYQLQRVRMILP